MVPVISKHLYYKCTEINAKVIPKIITLIKMLFKTIKKLAACHYN